MTNDEAADFQDMKAALLGQQLVLMALLNRMAPAEHAEFMDLLDFTMEDLFRKSDAPPDEQQERERLRQGVLEHVAQFQAARRR
jgi:hypothetical protein